MKAPDPLAKVQRSTCAAPAAAAVRLESSPSPPSARDVPDRGGNYRACAAPVLFQLECNSGIPLSGRAEGGFSTSHPQITQITEILERDCSINFSLSAPRQTRFFPSLWEGLGEGLKRV